MISPLLIQLAIAGFLAFLTGMVLIPNKVIRRPIWNIAMNGLFAYIIGLKLSLLFTNSSSISAEPFGFFYLWGGQINMLFGMASTIGYFLWYILKKSSMKREHGKFLALTTTIFLLAFVLVGQFFRPANTTVELSMSLLKDQTDLHGDKIEFKSGQITILNFWATWCPPCRAEMPELNAFTKEHEDINFITINNITSEKEGIHGVAHFIKDRGYEFKVLPDYDDEITSLFKVTSFPTTLVFDSQGKLLERHVGTISKDDLEGFLRP